MAGKIFDGVREAKPLMLHQKADSRAVGAAAEAVVELFARAYRERGRLLFMKWTTGGVIGTGFFKRHHTVDDFDDIRTSQ